MSRRGLKMDAVFYQGICNSIGGGGTEPKADTQGESPTSVVTSPGKYAGGWQGCQKALFLTCSPPYNLTATWLCVQTDPRTSDHRQGPKVVPCPIISPISSLSPEKNRVGVFSLCFFVEEQVL